MMAKKVISMIHIVFLSSHMCAVAGTSGLWSLAYLRGHDQEIGYDPVSLSTRNMTRSLHDPTIHYARFG